VSAAVERLCARLEAVAATLTEPEDVRLTDARRRLKVKLEELPALEAKLAALTHDYADDLARITRLLSDSRFDRLPSREAMQKIRDGARGTMALLESTQKVIGVIKDRYRALTALAVQAGGEAQIVDLLGQARGNTDVLPAHCRGLVGQLEALDHLYRASREFGSIYQGV
jgi:hypothetical protein